LRVGTRGDRVAVIRMSNAFHRAAVITIAAALLLVPAVARAHQRVERRDATRLSIKHSWIAVAPPTKAVVAPQQIVAAPAIATGPARQPLLQRAVIAPATSLPPVLHLSPDPLRGPPSLT